jgi:hypothetical protein
MAQLEPMELRMRILMTVALALSFAGPADAAQMVRACPRHQQVCWQICIATARSAPSPSLETPASGLPTGQRMH